MSARRGLPPTTPFGKATETLSFDNVSHDMEKAPKELERLRILGEDLSAADVAQRDSALTSGHSNSWRRQADWSTSQIRQELMALIDWYLSLVRR